LANRTLNLDSEIDKAFNVLRIRSLLHRFYKGITWKTYQGKSGCLYNPFISAWWSEQRGPCPASGIYSGGFGICSIVGICQTSGICSTFGICGGLTTYACSWNLGIRSAYESFIYQNGASVPPAFERI